MCARIHQSDAVTGAKQEQRVFEDADAVVGDAVKQQISRSHRLCGSHFPAAQQNSIRSANVQRFALNTDLREGSIGLLDEVGVSAPNGMQEGRSDKTNR